MTNQTPRNKKKTEEKKVKDKIQHYLVHTMDLFNIVEILVHFKV